MTEDQRINDIATKVDRMCGQLDIHLPAQDAVNSRLLQLIESSQDRIDRLESKEDRRGGFIAACSIFGGMLMTLLGKLFT